MQNTLNLETNTFNQLWDILEPQLINLFESSNYSDFILSEPSIEFDFPYVNNVDKIKSYLLALMINNNMAFEDILSELVYFFYKTTQDHKLFFVQLNHLLIPYGYKFSFNENSFSFRPTLTVSHSKNGFGLVKNEDREEITMACLHNAREEIWMNMYTITHKTFIYKIIDKHHQGINCDIFIDENGNNLTAYDLFRRNGVNCEYVDSHDKTCIFDNEIVLIGSQNISQNAFQKYESLYIHRDKNFALQKKNDFKRNEKLIFKEKK
ncbi:hypothetical protein CF386_08695 [Paraphotobacterium marinum]|uniref:phospholipase D n=1 Tax=Paraphotobacterium marinum TaxID=1755811 RepID=A0A220VFJ8_9GAMM|nr:phospholipase D-like domain-containing protein [Paraphotobacterium marinum]ASK79137.1 hypothetical protein CF386_08695 [Paraphotobacterium marinum]